MSYQVIARKYRPQKFTDIIGQEHITRTLQNAILENRLHHAYLFTGIRGIGKTTLARIFAKILNCEKMVTSPAPEPCNECESCKNITSGSSIDVQEIDGASNTGVDDVREIRERVKYLPSSGKYKIYIIDEVHMLSTAAFNALLKTLEEPPAHVIFVFATTEAQKIPATILSRCQRYDFRRITTSKVVETLKLIARSENVEVEEECFEIIANEAEGSMRDAESLFDQAIAYAGKKLAYSHLKDLLGFLDQKQIDATVRAIVERDAKTALAVADELFQNGENLNRFALSLMNKFHDLLIQKTVGAKDTSGLLSKITIEECQQWFNMLYKGSEDVARTKFQKIVLDVLLANLVQIRPVKSIDELLEKVEALSAGKAPVVVSKPPVVNAPLATTATNVSTPAPIPASTSSSWGGFTDWLKLNRPQVAAFLDSSNGGSISGSSLVIKFANRSFASDRLLEADRKAFLEKLAMDYFKKPMKLDVQFENHSEDAAVQIKIKKNEELSAKQRDIKEEALKHEVIREAANIFGAEIKDIKIK